MFKTKYKGFHLNGTTVPFQKDYGPGEIEDLLQYSAASIRRLIQGGKMKTFKRGGRTRISYEEMRRIVLQAGGEELVKP